MLLNRKHHSLPPGEHVVIYTTTNNGENAMEQGWILVTGDAWLLVLTWQKSDDGDISPATWLEVPDDCPYQLIPRDGKQWVLLTQAIDIQAIAQSPKKRVIWPAPEKPPMS
jgi:hypothetical protein